MHVPVRSHAIVSLQLSSCAYFTGAHTPGLTTVSQASHWPHEDCSQQTPSTQWPVSHSLSFTHASPCEWYSHVSFLSPPSPCPPKSTTRPRPESYAIEW